jgi:hypothetical protein
VTWRTSGWPGLINAFLSTRATMLGTIRTRLRSSRHQASPNALLTVAGTLSQSGIEAWENTSYVQTARNGDCDKMLVRRQRAAAMDERFEQPSRIVLAGVDHRTARGIPPSRRDGRSCPVENWILAVRVSNPKADQSAVKNLCGHAAVPYFRRPRISTTSSAPNSLWITTSMGRLSSIIG